EALKEMLISEDLIEENEAIYLPPFYHSERGTAKKLLSLLSINTSTLFDGQMDIDAIQKQSGIEYDDVQIAAIKQAIVNKVMVLTGGPGTGKTTTTQGIIAAYKAAGLHILLAAPTGRASKRMSEATGMEAKTIHRLLEYNPQDGYKRNDENPLEGDALIVDECSMIDIILMYNLMKAIPEHMRLVMVGDIDQLPSVGAGNVLRDIIESEKIPVIRLTRIFRQAQSSRIVMSAHAINQGRFPDISNGMNTDFFFIKKDDPEQVADEIVKLVRDRLPKAYKQPLSNIQVLTPMQRSVVGAGNLNVVLQQALNHNTQNISRGGNTYKLGDRVMQIRNNYDKNVFNGDIGTVEKVNLEDRTLTINFDDIMVEYEASELDEVVLAYATTIHKSQGSEYPIVVIPVLMTHFVMLQRNLIYTGITRAKKICVLIGQTKALSYAIRNLTVSRRNTLLKERLRGEIEERAKVIPMHEFKPYEIPEEDVYSMAAEPNVEYNKRPRTDET
ncbi:MAG: AAA family ATPase, partial [Bacteroidales bacterium]|nr:AAA family ATPase [Bacteroidales bacterium]